MKKNLFLSLYFLSFFLYLSCDILRSVPFELSAISVEEGTLKELPEIITLRFSLETTIESAYTHISLSSEGEEIYIYISISGAELEIKPAFPLSPDKEYRLYIGEGLQARDGQRLLQPFSRFFSLLPSHSESLLLLLWQAPEEKDSILRLDFSHPLDADSARREILIYPALPLIRELEKKEEGGANYILRPLYGWKEGVQYRCELGTKLCSTQGLSLGLRIEKNFRVEPVQNSLERLDFLLPDLTLIKSFSLAELLEGDLSVTGLCPNFLVEAVWAQPLGGESFDRYIHLDGRSLEEVSERNNGPASRSVRLTWRENGKLRWGSLCAFSLKPAFFIGDAEKLDGQDVEIQLALDNPAYRPPELLGVRAIFFKVEKEESEEGEEEEEGDPKIIIAGEQFFTRDSNLKTFFLDPDFYPLDTFTPFALEFFILSSKDHEIDPFDFLASVQTRIDSEAATLLLNSFSQTEFSLSALPEALASQLPDISARGEALRRLELKGNIANRLGSGLFNIRVSRALKDSGGNKAELDWNLVLCK